MCLINADWLFNKPLTHETTGVPKELRIKGKYSQSMGT